MTSLLRLLDEHPDAVEADLARFYSRDYRDRWHPNPRRRITFRQLAVWVRWLPTESAVHRVDNPIPWGPVEYVLDEIRKIGLVQLGHKHPEPHPLSPAAEAKRQAIAERNHRRRQKIAESKRRDAERLARLHGREG